MKCTHFDNCNAPLCPQNEVSIKKAIWFSDESICKMRVYSQLQWIKNQRKIKRVRVKVEDGYFTVSMLDRRIMVKKGIKGIDPDKDDTDRFEKKWIIDHPPLKEISIERRKMLSERLKKYRETVAQG